VTQRFGATVESRSLREESVYFPLPRELRGKLPGQDRVASDDAAATAID
jgi:hypothetical protein